MTGERPVSTEGTVVEALPHAMFAIELDSGRRVLGHIAGTIGNQALRINPGDRVVIELSPYDRSRARITRRVR
jgi:translation initiation factor IF-1